MSTSPVEVSTSYQKGVYFVGNRHLLSLLTDTIFAFLTLNTPRSAHKEIIGAKFSSFERAATSY